MAQKQRLFIGGENGKRRQLDNEYSTRGDTYCFDLYCPYDLRSRGETLWIKKINLKQFPYHLKLRTILLHHIIDTIRKQPGISSVLAQLCVVNSLV